MTEDLRQSVDNSNNKDAINKKTDVNEVNKMFESNIGEYLNNKELIKYYSESFSKTPEKIKEAITTIFESCFKKKLFELLLDDKIKKSAMIGELETFFENNKD